MNTLIKAKSLFFKYGSELILENVSFEINEGDFVGIIGPNGSGKTTLLKLILGLLKMDKGSLELFGQPVQAGNNGDVIGYIPQKVTQLETRFPITVEEVVELGRINKKSLFRRFSQDDHDAVTEALKTVGLLRYRNTLITDLSGGQQQRAFIAKALAGKPKLLLLDEPTVGIDLESQENFYHLLTELNQKHGLTIIIVSHDIDTVITEVSSVLCLNKTIVYHGNPKEFAKAENLEKLYGKK